jgi:tRNA-Thr(GGU) m(6)t(6)A37 methyltransferase TsaA
MKIKSISKDKAAKPVEQIADLKKRWLAHSAPPAVKIQADTTEKNPSGELQKRSGMETFQFRAIGHVENRFLEPTIPDALNASPSRIVLAPDLLEGLIGLEPGAALLVVFVFHRARDYDLLQHPRGDCTRPKRGVFALRSPNRPNPIGISRVELLSIEENVLTVRDLDALDGTPVLDLKPA